MSIFKNLVDNVSFALNKKKMKTLKAYQVKVNSLNKQLINVNSEVQEKTQEITNLNKQLIETLEEHNLHQQNLHAKKDGFKSAFQYKMKIKTDIFNNEQKQKELTQQQEKYQKDLEKNLVELRKINNTLLFYNNLQTTTILGFIISVLITLSYILLAVNPASLFGNTNNFIIYCVILGTLTLIISVINFFYDVVLYKKLELGKLYFYHYAFPMVLIINILLASMPSNLAKSYTLFVFYFILSTCIFIVLIRNEMAFKKNKNYCFPLDFTMFNLPFVNFTAITLISASLINNDTFSLIIKIIYAISTLVYIILFAWQAITNRIKGKDFKQYIFLTISILLLVAYISCAVINFIPDIPQAIELIVGIGSFINLFSPLYHGFKKSSNKID